MTIGLDTSVVVRLLEGDPPDQLAQALRRIRKAKAAGDTVIVTDLVVAEAYFTLQRHYGVPKDEARRALIALFDGRLVEPEPTGVLVALGARSGPGLVDRLIHERYRALGVSTLTFDGRMAKLGGAEKP